MGKHLNAAALGCKVAMIAALMSAGFAPSAAHADFSDSADLLTKCRATLKISEEADAIKAGRHATRVSDKELADGDICVSTLAGTYSGLKIAAYHYSKPPLFCAPEHVSSLDLAQVYVAYASRSKHLSDYGSPVLFFDALTEAYPCPAKKPG